MSTVTAVNLHSTTARNRYLDKASAVMASNPQPVMIPAGKDNQNHKVKVFLSPDHSIKPVVDFIGSAKKSIDMYMPEWKTWTYPSNTPLAPPMWLKEENPIFQSLVNAGVKKIKMRFLTQGPQKTFIPLSCDIWEWFIMQDAGVNFIQPDLLTIGGIMMIIDGGEKILITTMSGNEASFIYNRESSIILETKCEKVAKLFQDTFDGDFSKGTPFTPTKKMILNSKPPQLDPASVTLTQTFIFASITSRPQPPTALVKSPLSPNITGIMEADDVQYTLAMAGPELAEWHVLRAIYSLNYVQVATQSLTNASVSDTILTAYKQNASTSVNISYMLVDKKEAQESDENIQHLYTHGMNYRVFRGPLYDEKPETKKYFTHNGQNYINTGAPETHFMTGTLSRDDLNKKRNFYVAFNSPKLTGMLAQVFTKDQEYAPLWNPSNKTAVGPEEK